MHLKFSGGVSAGTVVSDVAGVFSIGNDGETFGLRERGKFCEEFVFAEIAAVVWVGEIFGVLELFGANDTDREMKLLGDREGFFQFTAREAGRIGDYGE